MRGGETTFLGVAGCCSTILIDMALFIRTLVTLLALCIAIGKAQTGLFPQPIAVATNKIVTSSSECGQSGSEQYCRYTFGDPADSLHPNCQSAVCNNTCFHSDRSPEPLDLIDNGSLGSGVTAVDGRPGSSGNALQFSLSFVNVTVPQIGLNGFSFTVWIRQDQNNDG